jgi:peptide/nickel transport system permease protein
MLRLIGSRLISGLLTLLLVSVLVFFGAEAMPGNAATAILGRDANDPVLLAQTEQQLGLDRPVYERYIDWLTGFVHGDLGVAAGTQTPITDLIGHRLVNTAALGFITLVLLVVFATTIGTWGGVRKHSKADSAVNFVTIVVGALPEFVVGIFLVLMFALVWPVLPAVTLFPPEDYAFQHPKNLILPVATLLLVSLASVARLVRASVSETLDRDFIEMARLKGIPERTVIFRHVLPNSLVPTIQICAFAVAWLVGGVVIVEAVFQYPGVGTLMTSAVSNRDIPLVQAIAMLAAAAYILAAMLADVLTILVTPRLRTAL